MKTLLLIRHAHRDNSDPALDNGLSKKGQAQAKKLAKYFRRRFIGKHQPVLLSSPKQRCLETLVPIAVLAGEPLAELAQLAEQGTGEGGATYERRVRAFCAWWKKKGPEFTVVCSHGDWLPKALGLLTGIDRVDFKKGGLAQVSLREDGWVELVRLLSPSDY